MFEPSNFQIRLNLKLSINPTLAKSNSKAIEEYVDFEPSGHLCRREITYLLYFHLGILWPLNEFPYKQILKASSSVVFPVPFFPPKIMMGLLQSRFLTGSRLNDCSSEKTPSCYFKSLNLIIKPLRHFCHILILQEFLLLFPLLRKTLPIFLSTDRG